MSNKRQFYAHKSASIAPEGSTSFTAVHGLQVCTIDTSFNTEKIFEIGQLSDYEIIEETPDVTVTMTKVLDGYPLLWHLSTEDAGNATLVGRSNQKCNFLLNIYPDDFSSASGTPLQEVLCSGMYPANVSYSMGVDDNFTEDVSLVGNSKVWRNANFLHTGTIFDDTDSPLALTDSGGVQRRQEFIFSPVADGSILPVDVAGITSSGGNEEVNGIYGAAVQSVNVSCDFGRTGLKELGRKLDYHKYIDFPVDVTTDIEIIAKSGDLVDCVEDTDNLTDRQITIKVTDGTKLDLGAKNKLSNISMGGGDATGGNDTITYSFTNSNLITVTHPQDPTVALRG
jgi:hypothetical protein